MARLLRVLFLDIDGVLNSDEFFQRAVEANGGPLPLGVAHLDPVAVTRVQDLVRKTNATVVLSSSWRYGWPIMTIAQWLGIPLFGATPIAAKFSHAGNRGQEISRWLERIRPDRYAILDDSYIYGHDQHFVQTDHRDGLTDLDCRTTAKILRGTR